MSDPALQRCNLSKWKGKLDRCRWCNKRLVGRQRRWCSDECPQAMIENHWWSAARGAALRRDGHKCVRCGSDKKVEVHHRAHHAKGRHSRSHCCHHVIGLETLCHVCHLAEHRKLAARKRSRRKLTSDHVRKPE